MLGRSKDRLYYRRLDDGRTVGYVTGSEVLQDVELLRASLERDGD